MWLVAFISNDTAFLSHRLSSGAWNAREPAWGLGLLSASFNAQLVPLSSQPLLFLKGSQKWLEMKYIWLEWNTKFTEYEIVSTFSFQHFDSEATENSHEIKLMMRTLGRHPVTQTDIYWSVKRHSDNPESVDHGNVEVNWWIAPWTWGNHSSVMTVMM